MDRPCGRGTGPNAASAERAAALGERAARSPGAASPCDTSRVRLTQRRVVLRVVLLSTAGAFMIWRAWARFETGKALGGDGLTLRRLALLEGLLGLLALALAAFVAFAARPKSRRRTLGLGDRAEPPSGR